MKDRHVLILINMEPKQEEKPEWFAIRARQDLRAEEELSKYCDEVLFPKERVKIQGGKDRIRPVIPRVLFIKSDRQTLINLEIKGREHPELNVPFWIYRYPKDKQIQVIPQSAIDLIRLLTAGDTTRCEIFNKKDFKENLHVRVTGGPFKGYQGYVQRVKKNKHVVVKIEGVCVIMLPFIHPDLLEIID